MTHIPTILNNLRIQARALEHLGLDREAARILEVVKSIETDYPGVS